MHLSLAFPGVDPGTPTGNPREHARNGTFLTIFLGARGGDIVWFWKRTLQTPGMHPRDLVAIGQRYMVFKMIGTSYMIIIMYRTSLAVCVPSCLVTLLD